MKTNGKRMCSINEQADIMITTELPHRIGVFSTINSDAAV